MSFLISYFKSPISNIVLSLYTINIEAGRPVLEEARKRLSTELENAVRRRAKAVKIIHGYGSSGVGGTLRTGIRQSLLLRKRDGRIKEIIFGENWGPFNPQAAELLERYPVLKGDSDYGRDNAGITIIILK